MEQHGNRLLFRVDANESVGMGHLMRSLSIADAAHEQGIECLFVMADGFGADLVIRRGYRPIVMDTDYRFLEEELSKLRVILTEESPTVVIVDSYFASERYLENLSQLAPIAYLDDWATQPLPVHYLINYNLYSPKDQYENLYRGSSARLPQMLLGPAYAPLRKEFAKGPRVLMEPPKQVFLLVGGTDPERMAIRMIAYLDESGWFERGFTFHLMVGSSEPDMDALKSIASHRDEFEIHENVSDVATLMRQMDIAVSASGSTLYELCACGIPTICYALSDDQVKLGQAFAERGAMLHGGDYRDASVSVAPLFERLDVLMKNEVERARVAQAAIGITDGLGASRIVSAIFANKAM